MKTTPLGCPPIDTWCTAASASVRNSTYTKNRIKGEGGLTRRCKLLFAEKPTDPRCGRSYQLAARSQRARRNQHVRWLVPQRESLQHRSSWWPKKHEIIGNFVSFHFTSAKSHIPTARAHLLHLVMRGLFGAAAATATLFALLLPLFFWSLFFMFFLSAYSFWLHSLHGVASGPKSSRPPLQILRS